MYDGPHGNRDERTVKFRIRRSTQGLRAALRTNRESAPPRPRIKVGNIKELKRPR
jgi:hypothetical protein